jgi:ribosomal protein S18 acetylase RimI-like enzyme
LRTSESLRRSAIESNLREAFSVYSRACGEKVKRLPGVTCVRHPSKVEGFNMAFLTEPAGVGPRVLRGVQEFYREAGAEWCFVVPSRLAHLYGQTASRIRISARRPVPEMVLGTEGVSIPSPPTGLDVRPVRTLGGLRTWARTGSLGFGDRVNHLRFMVNRRSLEEDGFICHTGWSSGKPVATSASYTSSGVTVIMGVSTIPEARGRGFGEAMTWAAVRDGIERRSRTISLQASPVGFPVYHRMGFRHVFDFEEWVIPRSAPDAKE